MILPQLVAMKKRKNPLSLLDQEPPLLGEDSDVWHKPHRVLGDLAEARLPAFPRGSICIGHVSVEVCTS
jgi:hypothetical protein